jgi:hypothetical protein
VEGELIVYTPYRLLEPAIVERGGKSERLAACTMTVDGKVVAYHAGRVRLPNPMFIRQLAHGKTKCYRSESAHLVAFTSSAQLWFQ